MIKTKELASPLPATSCQKRWKSISQPSWKVVSKESCHTGQPGILTRWVASGYYGNLDASLCYCFFIEAATAPIKKKLLHATTCNISAWCDILHMVTVPAITSLGEQSVRVLQLLFTLNINMSVFNRAWRFKTWNCSQCENAANEVFA